MQARITELESAAEQAKGKAGKLEKDKSRMTMEIKDISIQLDEVSKVSFAVKLCSTYLVTDDTILFIRIG